MDFDREIYLDHAAATPLDARVREAMEPFLTEQFFNPSAPYAPAWETRHAFEGARADLAHAIGAKPAEIILTAGATESVNLAFSVLFGKLGSEDISQKWEIGVGGYFPTGGYFPDNQKRT